MADKKSNPPHSKIEDFAESNKLAPKIDETDLVDARELPSEEDITEARHRVGEDVASEPSATERDDDDGSPTEDDGDDPFAMQMEAPKPGHTTIASLRERLAAFLVDMGVLWLLFWGGLFVFHKITTHHWVGPVPTMGTVALLFHGIFLFVAFLYFFLLEASFFATIGKFCCWMYVRRKDGRHAGAFGVFIRNFFRLIELLTGGLLTWAPMELSRRHQRLGDMAAGTIVIKKHSATSMYYSLDANRLASAFGRSIAQLIDLSLVLIWLLGYVMLINYQATILSQWLVIAFPVVFILFWTLVQMILETTPGLWLIGYTITHEDGGRLTFAGALLRVLLVPLDLLLGFPCMLLGLRKQKIGDMVAATVVSRQHRRWKGAIGSLAVVAFSVGLVALGLFVNPLNNVFKARTEFKLSFLPRVEGLPDWELASSAAPSVLTLRNFRFGVNEPGTLRTPPVYEAGETVYLLFEIYGYTRKDRMVWIQEDLMVQYPDGSIGLKQENVVDYHQIMKPGGGQIELTNNIALPPTAAPGTYVVTVTLRDMLANSFTVTDTQSFTVKAPPTMTSPLEAPSPLPAGRPDVSPPPPPAGEGPPPVAGEGAVPTVPSSPIPVMPESPPQQLPSPPAGEGQPPAAPGGQDAAGTPPPALAPTGGFTVMPGPTVEPKQEVAPAPTIPVPPPSAMPPADQYGTKSVAPIATTTPPSPPSVPAQSVTAPVPTPTTAAAAAAPVPPSTAAPQPPAPAIIEKTLTPTVKPADQYGAPIPTPAPVTPADAYGKPEAPRPEVPIAPIPSTTKTAPAAKPAKLKPSSKEKSQEPSKSETGKDAKLVTPKASTPKSAADQELRNAAEKELQKIAPAKPATPPKAETPAKPAPTPVTTPAKPAAEIPSASDVKKQAEQAPTKPKKKKASSGGNSSGGYMP